MRKLLLAALLISHQALSACATPPQAQTTGTAPTSYQSAIDKKPLEVKYFKAEMEEAARDMSSPLVAHCAHSETPGALDQCFRKQLDVGFDPSGKGREACRQIAELNPYSECIIVGNLVDDLRRRLPPGQDTPMTPDDWRKPKPYLQKVSVKLTMSVLNSCLEAKAGDVEACARAEYAKVLKVDAKLQQRCDALTASNEFITCVGEAYALQFINAGAARMSAIDL